jgi:hypothetical protein
MPEPLIKKEHIKGFEAALEIIEMYPDSIKDITTLSTFERFIKTVLGKEDQK